MQQRSIRSYVLIGISALIALVLTVAISFTAGMVLSSRFGNEAQLGPAAQAGAADAPTTQVAFATQAEAAPAEPAPPPAAAPEVETDLLAAYEQVLIDLYDTATPSVVSILVNQGQGSGFAWDDEGHIVTNHHVVADAVGGEVTVVFANGQTAKAKVLGTDPDADLAVIRVNSPPASLRALPLGDSDVLEPGQLSFAIGNPFGQEFTLTSGIISAVGRTIRSGNTPFSIPEVIQTDAAINPGNSGGPLLNRAGEVIGINTQIISRSGASSGIGFSVPVNIAKQVIPVLIEGNSFEYAWLGISGIGLSADLVELLELPEGTQGALITDVVEDGPAQAADLLGVGRTVEIDGEEVEAGGDIITAIDGQPVQGLDDVITYLVKNTRPGDEVALDVIHPDGQTETVTVTLGVRPHLGPSGR
ncbi:MAG: S1C family serine protease [Anaerolineae bacterium]